jgi:AAA domain
MLTNLQMSNENCKWLVNFSRHTRGIALSPDCVILPFPLPRGLGAAASRIDQFIEQSDRCVGDESLTAKYSLPFGEFMALPADEMLARRPELGEIAVASDWTPQEYEDAVAHAAVLAYIRTRPLGSNGQAEPFLNDETRARAGYEPQGEPPRVITPTRFVWRDPSLIPRRQWLYGKHYIRKFVSATFAPGGLGKTSLVLVEAVAMASGRALLVV